MISQKWFNVKTIMSALLKIYSFFRSTEVLSCALRSFLIAADVIKSMHERSGNKLTDNVMSLALESFLISLHVYCTTYTVLTETTGEQKRMVDYGRVLDSVKNRTRYWLNAKIQYCKREELLACLKVTIL